MGIVFNATEEQILQMFKNAIAASDPDNTEPTEEDLKKIKHALGYKVESVRGRMVNLNVGSNWKPERLQDYPDPETQGFADKYPTWQDLLESAGITDWKEVESEYEFED